MQLVRERFVPSVLAWLILCALMVVVMVAVGGITRLTHSGLSMADWKPITGFIPPLNDADWLRYFELYKQTPEYLKVNHGIDLKEFKEIFWWEFIHRVWGRLIGIVVLIPAIVFYLRGAFTPRMTRRILWLLFLGGLQGVVGWIMVKSGMVDAPYVSPIKLGVHLILALIIYAYLIWYIHDLLRAPISGVAVRSLHWRFALSFAVVMAMIFTGALVAGLKAGFIYNSWPLMGGQFIPAEFGAHAGFWVDIASNPASAQFVHRWFAIVTLCIVLTLWVSVSDYVIRANWRHTLLAFSILMQVVLGIATLLMKVPVALGVLHQLGALFVITMILSNWHGMTQGVSINHHTI